VLLVDDNDTSQLVATRMLAKLGYRADVAGSGRDALLAITAFNYAAVLMDCEMPEMDGYETTRRLRRAERGTGRHLPVIAMTAATAHGDREACLEAGMDASLTKPLRPQAIAETLQRFIASEPDAPLLPVEPRALDADRFAALRSDGEHLVAIVREYLEEGAALIVTLREALAEGDPQSVERAARTLKRASAKIGALAVSEVCTMLEALGRAAALGTAPKLVDDATIAFEHVREALVAETAAL
jgi:CheY-like chemotaxis protein